MVQFEGSYFRDYSPVASFTKEVNSWLAKRPLVFNGRLANRGLTSLVKEATGNLPCSQIIIWSQDIIDFIYKYLIFKQIMMNSLKHRSP